ncbi:hypothetical protein [Blastococcus sp. SYSU DS1021]
MGANVTDRASLEDAVARIREQLETVDLLVKIARLVDEFEVPPWEADPDQW